MNLKQQKLDALKEICLQCQQCGLYRVRNQLVFGEGNPDSLLMFIAEAPGQVEDTFGRPLIGPAGTLLRRMIAAIRISMDDVYLANILKCRPPANRKPTEFEISQCRGYVIEQIRIILPRYIICLGKTAVEGLLPELAEQPVSRLRNVSKKGIVRFEGLPVMITYHPSALLQNPDLRPAAIEDFRYLEKVYQSLKKESRSLEIKSLFE